MGFAAAGFALAAIGTAVSAYGQYAQGQSQKKWAAYNAEVAERDAETATKVAGYEANLQRKQTEELLGRQRASYGKAGVTTEGSPLLLMAETAAEGEMEASMIEWGGKTKAQRFRSEAALSRMKGGMFQRAGYYGAGSTLLTGASQIAYRYGQ